jgi:hypothetical protein
VTLKLHCRWHVGSVMGDRRDVGQGSIEQKESRRRNWYLRAMKIRLLEAWNATLVVHAHHIGVVHEILLESEWIIIL